MSPGPVAERVYIALKQRIRDGAYQPGERIDPNALTQELSTSASPIRDALHRLEGERLVESSVPTGFRVPLWTEPDLGDAYSWSADLLSLIIGSSKPDRIAAECANLDLLAGNLAEATGQLFVQLARASGNIEHRRAVGSLNTRLHSIRLAESSLLPDRLKELQDIRRLALDGPPPSLRRQVIQYHRKRYRMIPHILRILRCNNR